MDLLGNFKKKKISLEEIEALLGKHQYLDLYQGILKLIDQGRIEPIKKSGLNGKRPALHQAYRILSVPEDNTAYEDELKYQLQSKLKIDFYSKNMKQYEQDRQAILKLNTFLSQQEQLLKDKISLNERSYQIWQREKFLQREGGQRILKNLGLSLVDLNLYETAEPIAYYTHHKNQPQNILIIENKDTFYSMRRHLLGGNRQILGLDVGTLIYGGGKSVSKAFRDFDLSAEEYLLNKGNQFYYFGDLDYEGIHIYHQLAEVMEKDYKLTPFVKAYEAMIIKANGLSLAKTKPGQNRYIALEFLNCFNQETSQQITELLERGDYIPQEILTITDF